MDFLERSMTKDLVVLEMGFHDLVGFKGMERGCSEVGFLEKIFLLLNIVGDVDVLFFVSFVRAINNEWTEIWNQFKNWQIGKME